VTDPDDDYEDDRLGLGLVITAEATVTHAQPEPDDQGETP
jgi:hypothetical protein